MTHTLEREQRLSRSLLWRAQRSYFDAHGVSAWSSGDVPHYVTNNPALAHAYAQVVLGHLRDCRARPDYDVSQPFTIIELGAGCGRFAFLFLRAFLDLLGRSALRGTQVRYVMTDFTDSNLRFWDGHPALQRLLGDGVLDFAVFNAEQDDHLTLRRSGLVLGPGALRNPCALIANYVFDGISQDAFSVRARTLHECLVTVESAAPDPDLSQPDFLDQLKLYYTHREAALPYYDDPVLDPVLRDHLAWLGDAAAMFLFPGGAIQCLHRLSRLSDGRVLLLAGDRGASEEEPGALLRLALHGSFSTTVNFQLIGTYAFGQGGRVLKAPQRQPHLSVAGFVLGSGDWPETALAYHAAIAQAGPDDLYALQHAVAAAGGHERLTLDQLLSLIRLSREDPRVLLDCVPALRRKVGTATEAQRRDLRALVERVWQAYYAIGGEPDLAFALGTLLYEAGAFAEALALFRRSVELHGEDGRSAWNMALCQLGQGDVAGAARHLEEAQRLRPDLRPAPLLK